MSLSPKLIPATGRKSEKEIHVAKPASSTGYLKMRADSAVSTTARPGVVWPAKTSIAQPLLRGNSMDQGFSNVLQRIFSPTVAAALL